MSSPTAALITLGCKVNQYESEAIAEKLAKYGFRILTPQSKCDVYIINTCTVTAESERKCRQMIRRAIAQNPDAYIIVCGCLSQTDPESIAAIEGVDYICGNTQKMSAADKAIELINSGKKNTLPQEEIDDISSCPFESMSISHFDRTRAYVKIEDGCESKCTYCIIPSARGSIRSKPMEAVVAEVKNLTENGCREVVLTGIETGSYGKELGYDLADLLCELDKIDGIVRIRTGSLDPAIMKKGFVDRLSTVKSLAPHFHLSLQSGSSRILALMKRRYNADMAMSSIEYIRKKIPEAMFTTDIITGFSGETEEDFALTKEFMSRARFLNAHIFPYSEREGTPAATMPDKVPVHLRHERTSELIAFQKGITEAVIDSFISSHSGSIPVLFETYKNGMAYGHTASFIEVAVVSDKPLHSDIFEVEPLERNGELLIGRICK